MWAYDCVFYRSPPGLLRRARKNDGATVHHRVRRSHWTGGPSGSGWAWGPWSLTRSSIRLLGYDTPGLPDPGLPPRHQRGDFRAVCADLHWQGHPGGAGRGLQPCGPGIPGPFRTLSATENSPYRDWFSSTSAATRAITTASGMRAGRGIFELGGSICATTGDGLSLLLHCQMGGGV